MPTFVTCPALIGMGSNTAVASTVDFVHEWEVEQIGLKKRSSSDEECAFRGTSFTSHLRGNEVDAGILGCSDPEYVCIKDALSLLGGRCVVAAAAHRELQNTPDCAVKCTGTDACTGSLDPNNVGIGSCCGFKACYGVSASSIIGDGSCIGYKACYKAKDATIGTGSCTGDSIQGYYYYYGFSCGYLEGLVGDNSCYEYAACYQNCEFTPCNTITALRRMTNLIFETAADGGVLNIGDSSCRGQGSCEYSVFSHNVAYFMSAILKRNVFGIPAPTKAPSTRLVTIAMLEKSPTKVPTNEPTLSGPTKHPFPTLVPTNSPTMSPITSSPSKVPSTNPTSTPTKAPTMKPTTLTWAGKSLKGGWKSKSAKSMNTKSSKAATIWFQETGETSSYESVAKPIQSSFPKPSQSALLNWISSVQTTNSDGGSNDMMTVVTWKYEEGAQNGDEFIRS
ncbi:hypothetical protein HJC23_009299 [Cyclotella cryptica]|uniref:DUF7640 domain-containing protein n=1 Tax=Cyclotella cryptica TaxID=29204 RepID=A0ABD3QSE0_9STRA